MKGCNHEKKEIQKDQSPFETLYHIYYPDIYRFSFGITGSREEAEDITQDTFMKLYNQLKLPVPLLNPRAWLYRVATNNCYTLIKRKTRYREILEEEPSHPVQEPKMEKEFMRKQEGVIVRNLTRQLPHRDQVVLMLYQAGFSYTQMARIAKVKKSSVGVIISRAIDKLTYRLNQEKIEK